MTETKFNNEQKELSRRIDALNGRLNAVEFMFESNRASNGSIITALQKSLDEVTHPDVHYQLVRR